MTKLSKAGLLLASAALATATFIGLKPKADSYDPELDQKTADNLMLDAIRRQNSRPQPLLYTKPNQPDWNTSALVARNRAIIEESHEQGKDAITNINKDQKSTAEICSFARVSEKTNTEAHTSAKLLKDTFHADLAQHNIDVAKQLKTIHQCAEPGPKQ